MRGKFFLMGLLALVLAGGASAHSGGTDKNGCHKDSRTGTRHCH